MAAVSKSKVLVIGATGYIGKFIALAGPAQGHPTFALLRPSALSSKPSLIRSFCAAGITILQGTLEDHESLVSAIRQVDVVISAIGSGTLDQLKIIAAIKEAGTIKRFVPSEFGADVDRVQVASEPAKTFFELKVQVRRAVEEADIPYTYVVCNGFAGYYLSNLLQPGLTTPPRDKVLIYGSGNVKFVNVVEEDVGAYTIKAIDDPRTLNKRLHIRPPTNIQSINTLVDLWERKIGKSLEKVTISEEDFVKQLKETPYPENINRALLHHVVFHGYQDNFELGADDVEATTLYPDHKYTSTEEYLTQFL